MKFTLRSKLIFGGVGAAILPLAVLGFFAVTKAQNALIESANFQVVQIATDLSVLAEEIISREKFYAVSIAKTPALIEAASMESDPDVNFRSIEVVMLETFLQAIEKESNNRYEKILVTDKTGNVIVDSTVENPKSSLANQGYFKQAKTGKIVLSAPLASTASGNPILCLAAPINAYGQFYGTIVFVIKLNALNRSIASIKLGQSGYSFMIDKKGLIIAHPVVENIFKTNITQSSGMERVARNMTALESGTQTYTFSGVKKIVGYAPVKSTGWSIAVTQDEDEFLNAAHAIRNMVLLIGIIFAGIVVITIIWFVKGIMNRL